MNSRRVPPRSIVTENSLHFVGSLFSAYTVRSVESVKSRTLEETSISCLYNQGMSWLECTVCAACAAGVSLSVKNICSCIVCTTVFFGRNMCALLFSTLPSTTTLAVPCRRVVTFQKPRHVAWSRMQHSITTRQIEGTPALGYMSKCVNSG